VKHALVTSPLTHASHGGKKQPARWGWVEIPLPKYTTAGRKTVRLLTDQQGFSVDYAVVTSVRQFPPTETELKDLRNSRGPAQVGQLESKLIGYWTFDEGKGTSAGDSSPNRNGASLTPGVGWTEGRMGLAVTLTSASTCVRIGSPPTLSDLGPLTVMAWIRPARLSLGRVVAKEDGGRGRWMFIAGEKGIDFAKDFADQELRRETLSNLLAVGTWSHVSATWDGSTQAAQVHIYVNGVEATYSISQDGRGVRMSDAAMPLLIGNRGDLTRGFEGAIDDVRIYNRVLTPTDIMTITGLRSK